MHLKQVLYCFFFATWLLLEPWSRVLRVRQPDIQYFLKSPPGHRLPAILAVCTALVALAAYGLVSIWPVRWRNGGIVACLILAAYLTLPLAVPYGQSVHGIRAIVWAASCVIWTMAVLYVAVFQEERLAPMFQLTLVCAFGIFAANILPAVLRYAPDDGAVSSGALEDRMSAWPHTRAARVVWLVLDEFDYHLAFEQRPPELRLPSLDRLRSEAVFATNAFPPGQWTLDALPSYLTGQPYRDAAPVGASRLRLFPSPSGDPQPLQPDQTLPGRLAAEGARVALVGWYHPYCRLLAATAVDCYWEPNADANATTMLHELATRESPYPTLVYLLSDHPIERLLPASLRAASRRSRSDLELAVAVRQHGEALGRLIPEIIRRARDPNYDFVFAHLPLPHPPGITDGASPTPDTPTGIAYLDNLMAADQFVQTLRQAMEGNGLWHGSNVIVTSDHPLRRSVWEYRPDWIGGAQLLPPADHGRIPVIVKLRNQNTPVQYDEELPGLAIHDLALSLAQGELSTPGDLTRWLSLNRGRFPLSWPVKTLSAFAGKSGGTAGRAPTTTFRASARGFSFLLP